MSDLFRHIEEFNAAIEAQHGPFDFFALLHRREGLHDVWDLVASAPWADAMGRTRAIMHLAKQLMKALPPKDLRRISHVSVLPTNDPLIQSLRAAALPAGKVASFEDPELNDLFDRAYFPQRPQRIARAG